MTNLAPVPSETSVCATCSAPLVADQRYCLSCGQPCSPVRHAFLDVLEAERQSQLSASGAGPMPVAYTYPEVAAGPVWLRRYAPLFGVASVLLLAMIVGLLVGHWVTQNKAPAAAPQVIKVEGLGGTLAAAAPTSSTTGSTSKTASSAKTSGKSSSSIKSEEEAEEAEAKAEEKAEEKAPAKAPAATNLGSKAVSKLETSTGKKHEAELNKLSTAPIEVK